MASDGTRVPPVNINDYPAIKAHLDQHWDRLKKRQDKGVTQYNLRNCAYLEEFAKEKIVYPETSSRNFFAFDNQGYLLDKTSFLINSGDKYLLAVLNSEVACYFFNSIVSKMRGGFFSLSKIYVEQFPVPQDSKKKQDHCRRLADYVIYLGKTSQKLQSAYFEQLIDALVYELYFPEEMRAAGKDLLRHLGGLAPVNDEMTEEDKLAVIRGEFDRLYDPGHPARNIIETLDSVEVVRTIREAIRK